MSRKAIPRIICSFVGVLALGATNSFHIASQEKEKHKHAIPSIVKLTRYGQSGDDIGFDNKTFLIITTFGGMLTAEGTELAEANYADYFKGFNDPGKAIVLQIRNEKETSVATAFATVQRLLMSLPPNFKGKVYLCSKAF